LQIEFSIPISFKTKNVYSTYSELSWSINMDQLERIFKQIVKSLPYSSGSSQMNLLENLHFEIYLNEKTIKNQTTNLSRIERTFSRSFRTINAKESLKKDKSKTKRSTGYKEFEYKLTNLMSNVRYSLSLSARIMYLESFPSKVLTFNTLGNFLNKFNICTIFNSHLKINKTFAIFFLKLIMYNFLSYLQKNRLKMNLVYVSCVCLYIFFYLVFCF